MRHRSLVAGAVSTSPRTKHAVRALLRSDDARDVRLGLDLLAGLASPASGAELRQLANHADPEVRVRALVQLASSGDADARRGARRARRRSRPFRRTLPTGGPPPFALGTRDVVADDRRVLIGLLDDPTGRCAPPRSMPWRPRTAPTNRVVRHVVAAIGEPRTAGQRRPTRCERLGEPAVPFLGRCARRRRMARRPCLVRAAAERAASTAWRSSRPRSMTRIGTSCSSPSRHWTRPEAATSSFR